FGSPMLQVVAKGQVMPSGSENVVDARGIARKASICLSARTSAVPSLRLLALSITEVGTSWATATKPTMTTTVAINISVSVNPRSPPRRAARGPKAEDALLFNAVAANYQ